MSFIRLNKLPHTKVQYLPSIREAKSRNLLSHNGTVQYSKRILNLVQALTKFASRNFLQKSHIKKKSGGRKTRRCLIGNQIPYQTLSSFFDCGFFRGYFCKQNPGTHLNHIVSMAGLPDTAILGPGWCEVLILSDFYIKISKKKNILQNTPCKIWDRIWKPNRI